MVIVILGIVSSITSSIFVRVYENYIIQRATHNASLKTELAITQTANRLTYRIHGTTIARNPATGDFFDVESMLSKQTDRNHIVLEWIGYDHDSFSTANPPGWSGYCNTAATIGSPAGAGRIVTPGSNLDFTKKVITNLSGGTPRWALLFSLDAGLFRNAPPALFLDESCMGYNGSNNDCIHSVTEDNSTSLTTDKFDRVPIILNSRISDHYKLAWSAYAIVPVEHNTHSVVDPDSMLGTNDSVFDLELRYSYQPWAGIDYNDADVPSITLIKNVTTFKFSEQGDTMRLKLCATEKIGGEGSTNISICKEKVVMR